MTAREIILKALYEIDHSGMYTNVALKNAISNPNLLEIDRGFATEVILGVQKNKSALDYIIMKFSKVKIKKMSPWIKNILRMGAYQMYYMDRVPHSAACNESVKLAKRYGHSASSGFVNGVLRSVSRNIENIEFPSQDNILEYLEVVYSYPMWIVEKIVDQYGADEGEVILAEGNVSHPNTIRVNSLKTTAKELLEILKDEGIFCTLHDEIP
ncbi:MAG: transcription antitermination factor NusB, partial [Oscillospiraceae bacterium]